MTVFVTFAMGAKDAYFFNSPTHWAWKNLPADIEALFTKQPPINVVEFVLGENGAYFLSYRDHDGQILCRHYNLPDPLVTYLYQSQPQVVRDLGTLSVTLGPYQSYYAHDKISASWANLPSSLEKAVLHRLESQDTTRTLWKENGSEAPSFVSLGADGSYFMRTVGGGGGWDLRSKSEGMIGTNKFLDGANDFCNMAGLYLFPTHPDCYILLLMTGKAFAHLPDHTWEDYNKMAPSLPKLKQIGLPVPAIPQPEAQASRQLQPQPHFQQLISQTQPQKNPPGSFVFVPHNCCPPAVPAINDFNNCCPPCNSTSSQTPYFAQAQHGRNGTLGGSLFGHSTHRGGEANDFSTTSSSFSNTHTTSWTSND